MILLCVRWYVADNLSLRDQEETMAERSIAVDHTTIHRRSRLQIVPIRRKPRNKKLGKLGTDI